jgi:DNA-binding transcriptional LysR family regulator
MSRNVTLRQLRYFVAAAESSRLSTAATNEHVSQSAVTHAIQTLEETVGVKLFDRVPHGVRLTVEGQDFYHHALHILESVEDAITMPRFRARELSGTVRVAASYTLLGYFLPELMARFSACHAKVSVELQDMDRTRLERAVLDGEVDLGVAILSNVKQRHRFGHATLIRSRRQLWVAPSHPLAQLPAPSLRDIADHRYILLTADEGETSALKYWSGNGLVPNIALRTGSIEAVRGFVANGYGVTVLSDMVFRPWSLEGKRIESRPVADAVPHMEAGILWKDGKQLSAPADALKQFLMHACAA